MVSDETTDNRMECGKLLTYEEATFYGLRCNACEAQMSETMADGLNQLSVQVGGSHYKDCAIQPIQYIEANKLAFLEGCVVKRVTRHDKPTGKGREDIEKAIHELQLLLQLRYGEGS